MGNSFKLKEEKSDSEEILLFIENNHYTNITIMQIQHCNDRYKTIINISVKDNATLYINKNVLTFLYIYSGDQIKGEPITKIKSCHLFNRNTKITVN